MVIVDNYQSVRAHSRYDTSIYGLNDQGTLVGLAYSSHRDKTRSFLYENGKATALLSAPGESVEATVGRSINDQGDVVGYYFGDHSTHGFLESNDSYTTIDYQGVDQSSMTRCFGSNDKGEIVGAISQFGFIYKNGKFTEFKYQGNEFTALNDVNNHGAVVGWYADSNLTQHGFYTQHGQKYSITVAGSDSTVANGINDRGIVVGSYDDAATRRSHGYVYEDGNITTVDVPGSQGTWVQAINNKGEIAGYYVNSDGKHIGFTAEISELPPAKSNATDVAHALFDAAFGSTAHYEAMQATQHGPVFNIAADHHSEGMHSLK